MTTIKTRSRLRVLSENETNKKKQKNRTRRNRATFIQYLISDPDVKAIQWENENLFNKLI